MMNDEMCTDTLLHVLEHCQKAGRLLRDMRDAGVPSGLANNLEEMLDNMDSAEESVDDALALLDDASELDD